MAAGTGSPPHAGAIRAEKFLAAQQTPGVVRLSASMKGYRSTKGPRALAFEFARPAALAVTAIVLILVILPAALGAQAATVP